MVTSFTNEGNLLIGYFGYITCQPQRGRGEGLRHYIQNRYSPASRCFIQGICLLCVIFFPYGGGAGAVLFFFC